MFLGCSNKISLFLQLYDWPWPFWITCKRHRAAYNSANEKHRDLNDIVCVGDRVTAKHRRNRLWYGATVRAQCGQLHYSFDFMDGSFSDDVPPECVRGYDWKLQGSHPQVGSVLDVEWTGGKIFSAKFLGLAPSVVYTLEFDNGDKIHAKREEFFGEGERLPNRVVAKLGVSSEQLHSDFFLSSEVSGTVPQDSKREEQRQKSVAQASDSTKSASPLPEQRRTRRRRLASLPQRLREHLLETDELEVEFKQTTAMNSYRS